MQNRRSASLISRSTPRLGAPGYIGRKGKQRRIDGRGADRIRSCRPCRRFHLNSQIESTPAATGESITSGRGDARIHSDKMGIMTSAEREYAIAYLERTKAALLDATGQFSQAQWKSKPSSEAWSPAEC